jgi:hypothetical protein
MNDNKKPDYNELIDYFAKRSTNRHLYGGMYAWDTNSQVADAIDYTRRVPGAQGNVVFSWGKLNSQNQMQMIKSDLYNEKVKTPTMPWKAQPTKGIIYGKVLASDGSPVMDALVSVTETGKHRLSSADGSFALLEMDPGTYSLVIKKSGMAETNASATVEAGKVSSIEVKI